MLDCQRTQPRPSSPLEASLHWTVTWQAESLALQSATYSASGGRGAWTAQVTTQADGSYSYQLKPANGRRTARSLPAGALLDGSWPWQLSGLDFGAIRARGGRVQLVTIDANGNPSLHETAVQTPALEQVGVPAGSYQTWSVSVGQESAN